MHGGSARVGLVDVAVEVFGDAQTHPEREAQVVQHPEPGHRLLLAEIDRPAPDADGAARERARDHVQVRQLLVEKIVVDEATVLAVPLGVLGLQVAGREQPVQDRVSLALGEHGAELVGKAAKDGDLVGAQAEPEVVPPDALDRGRQRSAVLLHGGPEPVVVKAVDIVLGLLPRAARHHRLALVVNVQHQLGGLVLGVAEQLLEHEHDVGHQVDRIVPHDHDPWDVGLGDVLALWRALAYRCGGAHACMVANPRRNRKGHPESLGQPRPARRRLSPKRRVTPLRSRCSSRGMAVLRVVPSASLASAAVKVLPSWKARRNVATARSRTPPPRYNPGATATSTPCLTSAAVRRRSAPSRARSASPRTDIPPWARLVSTRSRTACCRGSSRTPCPGKRTAGPSSTSRPSPSSASTTSVPPFTRCRAAWAGRPGESGSSRCWRPTASSTAASAASQSDFDHARLREHTTRPASTAAASMRSTAVGLAPTSLGSSSS